MGMPSGRTFGEVAQRVDRDRLWRRLMSLARHGATPKGGVHRLALSEEEIAARAELCAIARDLDLETTTDAIGNLFFRMRGSDPDLDPVMTGSHIDTQPAGGKFDGAFGVLAGFETIEAMRDAGIVPRRDIVVVSWLNEEASRFAPGMMGSEAFADLRPLADILAVRDDAGISVADALDATFSAFPDIPAGPLGFPVHAFIEAHIEQGPLLEEAGLPVGVVTGMQGSRRFRVTVTGEESHAGTEPLLKRRDAFMSAVDIVSALRAAFHDPDDIVKFTIGRFEIAPNAPSVVASRAYFSIDLRHPEWEVLSRLGDLISSIVDANRGRCAAESVEIATAQSINFPPDLTGLIEDVAGLLQIPSMRLYSAAGHDARQLHYHCPTAMIFVPCAGGISHNEAESCTADDLAAGTRVLAETLMELAT